jgi:hypothetical protein
MTNGDGTWNPKIIETLTALFGLIAGIASLVYVGGGAIMALRLYFADLPLPLTVAARLSRETLISVGLSLIIAPMLIVAAIYLGWRVIRGPTPPRPLPGWPDATARQRFLLVVLSLAGGFLLTLPGLLWVVFGQGFDWNVLYGIVAAVVASLIIFAALHVREGVTKKYETEEAFSGRRAKASMAILWALTVLPGCVILGSAIRFADTSVCIGGVEGGVRGFLIGETDSKVYVGEVLGDPEDAGRRPRMLTIPFDDVNGIFVGPSARDQGVCDVVEPSVAAVP